MSFLMYGLLVGGSLLLFMNNILLIQIIRKNQRLEQKVCYLLQKHRVLSAETNQTRNREKKKLKRKESTDV